MINGSGEVFPQEFGGVSEPDRPTGASCTDTPNALLKLVKWNQITFLMDLVPFNQL